jgi:hypothetical protein
MDSFRVQTKRESFLHLPLTGWLPDRKPFPFVYVDISFPVGLIRLGLVRLFLSHVDWMGLEKIVKDFDLFGIETHPIPPNPHELRAKRTSPYMGLTG